MGRTRIRTRDNGRRWSGNGSKKLKKKKVKLYERVHAIRVLSFFSNFFIRILKRKAQTKLLHG